MSIKSLLQLILFLLIIIIIGGIYFVYFYSGSLKKQEIVINDFKIDQSNNLTNQSTNQEILEVWMCKIEFFCKYSLLILLMYVVNIWNQKQQYYFQKKKLKL